MRHFRYLITCLLLLMAIVVSAQNTNMHTRHKVEKSETVFGIAKKYGITIEDLINANPEMKKQGYELKKDDTLNIPYPKGKGPQTTNAPASANQPAPQPQQSAKQPAATGAQPITTTVSGRKNVKVGVMLPLHDNDGDGRRMVEYYRGLLLGVDRVKKDGITVEMQAWNVPIDADINNTLKEQGAADCDIIFGPLYTKMVKPLADFCAKNNTMMVIPFSISGNDVEN